MYLNQVVLNEGQILPEYLYRIVPLERFREMLASRRSALVSPLLWEDPYEVGPLRIELHHPLFRDVDGKMKVGVAFKGEPVRVGNWSLGGEAIRMVYCQSWTATPESDTMWRAYSTDRNGLRLRVRAASLLTALSTSFPEDSCFLAQVIYVPQTDLDAELLDGPACYRLQVRLCAEDGVHGKGWLPAIRRKRLEFSAEQEFRLVVVKKCRAPASEWHNLEFFALDPSQLIDEVTVDPRTSHYDKLEAELRAAGYTGSVCRSNLYKAPEYKFWSSNHPR